MKNKNGLTISMIFEAESANYGEGIGNVSSLKKLTRMDGADQYTYISRQAIRYNLMQQLNWDKTPIEMQGAVAQFAPDATIIDYPEIDLFGYMKTVSKKDGKDGKSSTRNAVVRLSHAIALEPFQSDMDFLTNMGLAKRCNENNTIAQSEIHRSFYGYTVTIDLDLVGIDQDLEVDDKEKASRVVSLLNGIEFLYRDIRGRRENLAPVFVIGGIYERKNPYFEHRLQLKNHNLKLGSILDLMGIEDVGTNTVVGLTKDMFRNENEIREKLSVISVHEAFDRIREAVCEYYM